MHTVTTWTKFKKIIHLMNNYKKSRQAAQEKEGKACKKLSSCAIN
jgi:hypothetical protein